MEKLLYRPREAAAVLGISKTILYGLIRANRIRSIKDGKFRFITADALHAQRDHARIPPPPRRALPDHGQRQPAAPVRPDQGSSVAADPYRA